MGSDRVGNVEHALTWLGAWPAMRWGAALVAALSVSVALCELLAPSAVHMFPLVNPPAVYFFALCVGVVLGLLGHYTAAWWDVRVFSRWVRGADRAGPGAELEHLRQLAVQVFERQAGSPAAAEREAVKIAHRQAERWAKIERPLILAEAARAGLSPSVFTAALALIGAALSAVLRGGEAGRLVAAAAASLIIFGVLLVPYCRLRIEYLMRLYRDVTAHAPKKKHTPLLKSETDSPKAGGSSARGHRS